MTSEPTEKPHSVRGLIELQRRLCQSKSPFVRRVGLLITAGALDQYLDALSDRQVGQLMADEVGRDLGIVQPESTICHQVTKRLFAQEVGASLKSYRHRMSDHRARSAEAKCYSTTGSTSPISINALSWTVDTESTSDATNQSVKEHIG